MPDARVLIGRPVARQLNDATMERVERFIRRRGRAPQLAVFTSEDPSAQSYLKSLKSAASKLQVVVEEHPLRSGATTGEVAKEVSEVGEREEVDGILIQTPLPANLNIQAIAGALPPSKDVDGASLTQAGMLFHGLKGAIAPSTARACIEILSYYRYTLSGMEVVVVGRSPVVGRPVALLALAKNATVTWCHSKTVSLPAICKRAEILIVAIGKPKMVNANFVRAGATVIDVGINVTEDGKIVGDVDVSTIGNVAAAYTPVPGGVGPVTTACLFANLLDAAEARAR